MKKSLRVSITRCFNLKLNCIKQSDKVISDQNLKSMRLLRLDNVGRYLIDLTLNQVSHN
jgi:hypothetical protein